MPKIDQKTQAFHFGVWFIPKFCWGGDFYHLSNPSKTQPEFELISFFFPLFDSTLKAEWDGFYRKMKELSKVSREVPAERPRCLHGGWSFFWGVFFRAPFSAWGWAAFFFGGVPGS